MKKAILAVFWLCAITERISAAEFNQIFDFEETNKIEQMNSIDVFVESISNKMESKGFRLYNYIPSDKKFAPLFRVPEQRILKGVHNVLKTLQNFNFAEFEDSTIDIISKAAHLTYSKDKTRADFFAQIIKRMKQ